MHPQRDRKSTRLNSSHVAISYAVFCLKKKKQHEGPPDHTFGRRGVSQRVGRRMGLRRMCCFFFFNDTATTEIYTLSLHDALPIWFGTHRGLSRFVPAPIETAAP